MVNRAGWTIPTDERTWCTTAADETVWAVTIHNAVIKRSRRADGLAVLGAAHTMNGKTSREFEERICNTWCSLYNSWEILCGPKALSKKKRACKDG